MSGLLDKAKDVAKDGGSTEDSIPAKDKGTGLLDKAAVKTTSGNDSFEPSSLTGQIGLASGFIALCIAVYMVWDLKNWEGIIPFAILITGWGLTSWGFKEMKGDWNKNRMIAIGITFLLVSAIPYFAAFSWEGGNVRASDFEIDEASDTLVFTVYNTGGVEATASIEVAGEEVWSKSGIDAGSKGYSDVEAPLSEIYQGSTFNQDGNTALTYVVKVSAGDHEWEGEVDPDVLERTVTAAGVDMIPVTEQEQQGDPGSGSEHTETNHLGIQIGVGIGMEKTNLNRGESGEGQWDAYIKQLSSDYTFTMVITYEGSTVWDTSTVFTVDGDSMTSSDGDSANFVAGWMELVMSNSMDTTQDEFGEDVHYIPRDDFYDGDGCYKTTLTITHTISTGGSYDLFSKTNGFHYYWEENENSDGDYKPAVVC
ncbi:MAG: hypothetical protein QF707_05780 [Candidatus Poseidoniaceae archaeon]|nr:hypothetical protein [Candidatus Poseidoniaceae archaeon]